MVMDGVSTWPDREILTFVDVRSDGSLGKETRTFAALLERAKLLAGALLAEGMAASEPFAIIMPNHPEFVEAIVASEIAGTVFVPIDPRTRGEKLAYMLRFAGCRGAIVSTDVVPALRPLLGDLPDLRWLWVLGDNESDGIAHSLESVISRSRPAVIVAPRLLTDTMQMLYTSGTTGDPKAIQSPYSRFARIGALGDTIGLTPQDRPYTGLSLTHANAQLITLGNALGMGLPLTISRQFTKSRLWEILARHECTTFNLLGGMATAIFAEDEGPWDRAHKVRYVLSAGMPAALWRPFEERFGVRIFEFFGAAEGGLTMNAPGEGPIGSVGKAPAGTICAILAEDDGECGPGVHGEICFRNADGSVALVSYYQNADASVAKTRGGWFRTGDIGYKDKDGWVFFSHRAGQSVRRNGNFISTGDIETVIATFPGVADTYVYGVSTPANTPGEKEVVAAIVPQSGDLFDPLAIFSYCAEKLGSTSVPSFVQIVHEIPKTASEKPQERYLVTMIGSAGTLFDRAGPTTINLNERERP
ncbi:MAG: AMP-binding protein [Novosphingobium sp.]